MADGRDHTPGFSFRATFPWMEIFRCFQVALDPRKLLVAAAGILIMSLGWYVLSALFYYKAPDPSAPEYQPSAIDKDYQDKKKPGTNQNYTQEDLQEEARRRYAADLAQWQILADLAGPYGQPNNPPGRFRAMPWDEYRGPNPFLFVTTLISGSAGERGDAIAGFVSGSVPVLVEPLVKLLVPVAKMISPGVSPQTRVYLFFVLIWSLAVWAFFGGVITRLAAIQLANKGPITLTRAVRFVADRYVNYLLSPLLPIGIIGAVVLGLIVYGVLGLIPVVGDIALLGLLLPLVILGGAVMAVFLVGLVGYPLMYPTLSVEGDSSDTFDALSRSINYVYQAPWRYIWCWLVAVVYGAAVTFFVLFFTSLMVYMGKWAVGLPASAVAPDRKPDFLFIYAPESFGWKELLLKDSPYEVTHQEIHSATGRRVDVYLPVQPVLDRESREQFWWYNTLGARLVGLWLGLLFLLMLGFIYSFFWSAATVIYFLLRRKVDEAEPDEVFVEEDEPEAPLAPPKIAEGTGTPAAPSTSLPVLSSPPVVPPPAAPTPAVVPPPTPPSPPIPLAATPPVVAPTPPAAAPSPSTGPLHGASGPAGPALPAKPTADGEDKPTV